MSRSKPPFLESRWVRWALLAFPFWARQRHGRALLETWSDAQKAEGLRAVKYRAAWDLLRNGLLLRWEDFRSPERRRELARAKAEIPKASLRVRGERVRRQIRLALRRLLKEPAFALTAIVIVGLGVGANTTIFSIVNAALFEPIPYERPEELVRIYMTQEGTALPVGVSYPEFQTLEGRDDLFEAVAFHSDITFLNLEREGAAESVLGEYYTASFFPLLGLQPSLGRGFLAKESQPGAAAPVGMLSHSAWRKRFGSDPSVIGSQVRVNGLPITIVGVGPKEFKGTLTGIDSELYLPWGTATQVDRAAQTEIEDRAVRNLFAIARLQSQVSREDAQSALSVLAGHLAADHPATNEDRTLQVYASEEIRSHPLVDRALIPVSAFFMVLVGLVLLVSISNLANLLLAKASGRKKEMALRLALGAQRRQLVGQLLTESTVLAGLGGLVGLSIAWIVPRWLVATNLPLPLQLSFDPKLDGRVLGFALLLSLATGLLFGIAPALSASRAAFSTAMRGAPARRLGRSRRWSLRDLFIVVQVSASTLLLAAGGLFLHSLLNGQKADPGFETKRAVVANIDAAHAGYREEDAARRFWNRYQEQVGATAGPENVALASRIPLGFLGSRRIGISTRGAVTAEDRPEKSVGLSIVSPNYWQVLDIPVVEGRSFRDSDDASAPLVAVVSQALAKEIWGNGPAIGQRLGLQGLGLAEVVGVSKDTRIRRLSEEPVPFLYLPHDQHFEPWMTMIVATDRPAETKELVRRELEILNPKAALFENKTMTEHLGLILYPARVASIMLVATGLLALVLASLGLYGMIALAIARRTREVGIRAALGASQGRITRMVVGEALAVVGVGLVLGLGLATLALQPLRGLLYGISPFDPISFSAVALLLGLVTLVASYLPARKTARIDVVSALKAD